MATEFRLLGDVAAEIDGRTVDIGHARQRCVLVVLLVDVNRVVPVDVLLDRVWGERLPQRARNTLSSYLSRLRQAFATAPDVALTRQPGGYLLSVDPMAVDLHRFRRLVGQARAAKRDTEPGEPAGRLFDQALALWRGQAFASLDTVWLNAMRDTLAAERHSAELDRNDLALEHGQHAVLLAELSTSAAAHPLDERLAGQFILALYRSARQADALHHYEQLRLRLAEELGADPSPPLQMLHRQILAGDPTLAWSARRSASSVPRQLPPAPRSFTGRLRELTDLDTILTTAVQAPTAVVISAVSGTAGVGKTALAVYWAHRVADRFPDGQLYVNLRGFDPDGSVMHPAAALRGFLDALGMPPQRIPGTLDAQVALYRSLLAGRRMLVVLDNARDVEQIRPLLPGAAGCMVVATSRNQLTGLVVAEGAHPLTLDLLTAAEARELLVGRLGADRVAADPEVTAEIIHRCARLPLALSVVAARAATHPDFPLAALVGELRDAGTRLDALAGADPNTDVRAVFSWSYHTLSAPAARLFRLLGLHPGPDIGTAAVASLAGQPAGEVRPLLVELSDAHLVTEHRPGRYVLHDLLRVYAAEQAHAYDEAIDRRAALRRALDHYLHSAHGAALLLDPHRDAIGLAAPQPGVTPERFADDEQAMRWFSAEHAVLLTAVQQAADAGFDTHTWQLPWTLSTFLNRRGLWRDKAATQLIALAAAGRLGDRPGQAEVHRGLALAYVELGRGEDGQTHLQHAINLYRALGDDAGQANARLNLARVSGLLGFHPEALLHAKRALELYRAIGHRSGKARALNSIGWFHIQLRDCRQALTYCMQALTLQQEIGDRYGQALTWDSLGYAHHHLGQHEKAVTCYRHALDLFAHIGDRYFEAEALGHLGDTHADAGDPDAARDAWQLALAIFDELDRPESQEIRAKLDRLYAERRVPEPTRNHRATRRTA